METYMSLKSIVNAVALGAIASASVLPMATAAEARDGRGHYQRHGGQGNWKGGNRQAWGYDNGYHRHRHSHRGRNVAIGAFAAVLGLAIAAEAARAHDDAYYDDDRY